MLHVYTGDGKGKTSASAGLAARGAGAGLHVLFIQFLKNGSSCEVYSLRKAGIECRFFGTGMFSKDSVLPEERLLVKEGYRVAFEAVFSKAYDMVIMDEVITCLNLGLLTLVELVGLAKSTNAEIVFTGRDAPKEIIDAADYVSDIRKVKHPYDLGVKARKGVEY